LEFGDIIATFVNSSEQLTCIFTKSLRGPKIDHVCSKLGTYDLLALAGRGSVIIMEISSRFYIIKNILIIYVLLGAFFIYSHTYLCY